MIKKISTKIRIINRNISKKIKDIYVYLYLKRKGVKTKIGYVSLAGLPTIIKSKNSEIILHKGCVLVSKTKNNPAGINHPVVLATMAEGAKIEIGSSGLSGASVCAVTEVVIRDFVNVGNNVNIYDTDFHALNPIERKNQVSILQAETKKILIEDYSWIGSGSFVLKGVTIGKGSIIGAGSVVTKNIPPLNIWAGNPAKFIKKIELSEDEFNSSGFESLI